MNLSIDVLKANHEKMLQELQTLQNTHEELIDRIQTLKGALIYSNDLMKVASEEKTTETTANE